MEYYAISSSLPDNIAAIELLEVKPDLFVPISREKIKKELKVSESI